MILDLLDWALLCVGGGQALAHLGCAGEGGEHEGLLFFLLLFPSTLAYLLFPSLGYLHIFSSLVYLHI